MSEKMSAKKEEFNLCQCGYILKTSSLSGLCPECGDTLIEDRGFVTTWRLTKFGLAKTSVILGVLGILVLSCLVLSMFRFISVSNGMNITCVILYPVVSLASFICAISRTGWPSDRVIAKWGLVLSLVLLLNPFALVGYASVMYYFSVH